MKLVKNVKLCILLSKLMKEIHMMQTVPCNMQTYEFQEEWNWPEAS